MNLESKNKTKIEGGMASMTDLVFLLLIFFIIMSLMSNNQTPLDLPSPDDINLPKDVDPVTATVMITQDNLYVVTPGGSLDNPMEFDEIKELAAAAVMETGKSKLKVAGHRLASYEAVFKVLALAQANEWGQ